MKAVTKGQGGNGSSSTPVIPMTQVPSQQHLVSYYEDMFARRIGMGAARFVPELYAAVPQLLGALNIQAEDEVIVSCLASRDLLTAIESCGARPVLVDIEPGSLQLCHWAVDSAVSPRTRAVVATHLHGLPCNMLAILGVTACRDLLLIEDCTQATGARILGQPVGTFGHASIWSGAAGYNGQELGGPGMVATRDSLALAPFDAGEEAFQAGEAAALYEDFLVRESHADWHRRTAALYTDLLSSIPEVQLPNIYEESAPAWERYVVRIKDRDDLLSLLWEKGIPAEAVQPPPDTFGAIQRMSGRCRSDCYATRAAEQAILLPVSDDMGEDDVSSICGVIGTFYLEGTRISRIVPVVQNRFELPIQQFMQGAGA